MKKVLFLSIIVPLLFAQPSDEQDPRAIVEKIRMWRLTQELDLSTEQAAVLFPKLNELRKIEKNYNEEKRQVLVELSRQKMEMQIEKTKEIMVILTPVQQARYLIFEDEFNREIREMIREVKKLKDLKR
jgi:hypothetical protein